MTQIFLRHRVQRLAVCVISVLMKFPSGILTRNLGVLYVPLNLRELTRVVEDAQSSATRSGSTRPRRMMRHTTQELGNQKLAYFPASLF